MGKGLIIGLIIIIAIISISVIVFNNFASNKPVEEVSTSPETSSDKRDLGGSSQGYLVEIIGSGFSPSTLTINKGDTILFQNIHPEESWPASVVHPTHTVYPGSGISKCGTAEENMIFDACGGLSPDYGTYSFTFNEVGTWNYHDHLDTGKTGTIIVQ